MLKPNDPIGSKKTAKKKSRVKVRDLTPQKETRGGGGALYPTNPPLSIPPRGFIAPSENANGE